MVFLGFKSHLDDLRDQSVAAQLAFQDKQTEQYTEAAFHPRMESASGAPISSAPADPLVAKGKEIFDSKGCSGCHGDSGTGTAAAPSLVGITSKYPAPQLTELLHHPNAAMLAGHMPAFDLSSTDMAALFSYLDSLGKDSASAPAPAASATPPTPAASAAPAASSGKPADGIQSPANKPAGTNSAAGGEKIFQAHGCAGCHGEAGAGTARVPPMTGLIANHSDAQLTKLLQSPDAKMQAGGMPALQAPPNEVSSVVAYLRSLASGTAGQPKKAATAEAGKSEPKAAQTSAPGAKTESNSGTATAPATATSSKPVEAKAADASTQSQPGRAVFVANGCAACHGQNAQGTHFAPTLIGITKKYPPAQLTNLLHHPKKAMTDGGMPAVKANDAQMQQLVAYLSGLGTVSANEPEAASHGTKAASAQSTQPAEAPKEVKAVALSAEAVQGRSM
jgi:mono/diheme cytochrome c family protein